MSSSPSSTGVVVMLSWRLDEVARWIADRLTQTRSDPFTTQLVVTPGPAHHRYLSQTIATTNGFGVCAGVETISIVALRRRLREAVAEAALPHPDQDVWAHASLSRIVLQAIDEVVEEPWAAPLRTHLRLGEARPGRRLATADRYARLVRHYCRSAPAMIDAWDRGDDLGPTGEALAPAELWQARLWHRLTELAAQPHPLTQHRALVERLTAAPAPGLPAPVFLLVTDALMPQDRELVIALGRHCRVEVGQLLHTPDDPSSGVLQRLGAMHREARRGWVSAGVDLVTPSPGAPPPATRPGLARLQAAVRGAAREASNPGEAAITWLPSHGPSRQVEVLRDHLCALFEEDPTLEPREVAILCPTMDAEYASLLDQMLAITPVTSDAHPAHELRVQVTDHAHRANDVLSFLVALLSLPASRATWQNLLDLCLSPPVATRFGFGQDDGQALRLLLSKADIRWGVDSTHRNSYGVTYPLGTWYSGVQRLALGATLADAPLVQTNLLTPARAIDSQSAALAGTLAEFVSRVRRLIHDSDPAPAQTWNRRLQEVITDLVSMPRETRWQIGAARAAVADWAGNRSERTLLGRADVRQVLEQMVQDQHGRPSFGTGALLATSLSELSGIPHRVIILLGLDDARFPGEQPVVGDDLTAGLALPGTIDRRERQQGHLLNALMAADQVSVIYQAASSSTLQPLDVPVAVRELRQAAAQAGCADQLPTHPLPAQAHSPANFVSATLPDGSPAQHPFSFDRRNHRRFLVHEPGHQRAALPLDSEASREQLQDQLLHDYAPAPVRDTVRLGDLTAFFDHPARAFLRARAGLTLTPFDTSVPTSVALEADGLLAWKVRDSMVERLADGERLEDLIAHHRVSPFVPPTGAGLDLVDTCAEEALRIDLRERQDPSPRSVVPINCDLDTVLGRRRLIGSVTTHGGLHRRVLTGTRLHGRHVLQTWISALALAVHSGSPPVGLIDTTRYRTTLELAPGHDAESVLADLVVLAEHGHTHPLAAPPRTLWAVHEDPHGRRTPPWDNEYDLDWGAFLARHWGAAQQMTTCCPDRATGRCQRVSVISLAPRLFQTLTHSTEGW